MGTYENALLLERALISKVVYAGQVERAMGEGLEAEHFADRQAAEVWNFVTAHARRYGYPPSAGVVAQAFPHYPFEFISDSLEYLIDQFKNEIKRRFISQALEDVAIAMRDPANMPTIEDMLLSRAMKAIELMPQPHVGRFSVMERRIDDYKARKEMGTTQGIRMGIPSIDAQTFGIQAHDFVSISGWQGLGKSTLCQHILFNAYLQGKTPMIFSLEMGKDALLRRWDTMKTNVEYGRLKGFSLTDDEMTRWGEAAREVAQRPNDIIIEDAINACTVDFVFSKMQAYKPDLVAVDYISLMTPPRKSGSIWEEITSITNHLKQIARRTGIPIIAIAQTNKESARSGASLDNIAYSRSIGQDSDLALGLWQDDDMRDANQMEIRLMKNRDGPQVKARMLWKPAQMMFKEWTLGDQFAQNPA